MRSPGAPLPVARVSGGQGWGEIGYEYDVYVPPLGQAAVMHYGAQRWFGDDGVEIAIGLSEMTTAQGLTGITTDEAALIQNFFLGTDPFIAVVEPQEGTTLGAGAADPTIGGDLRVFLANEPLDTHWRWRLVETDGSFPSTGDAGGTAVVGSDADTFLVPETGSAYIIEVAVVNDDGTMYEPLTTDTVNLGVSAPSGLAATPTPLSFGEVSILTDATQELTLEVTSGLVVGILNITSDTPEFSVVSYPDRVVFEDPASLTVRFQPTDEVAVSGALTVTHDGVDSPLTIPVSGTGTSLVDFDDYPYPTFTDSLGFQWQIWGNGMTAYEANYAYYVAHEMLIDGGWFPWLSTGVLDGREIAIGPATFEVVEVTRQVYVPVDAAYTRTIDLIENTTDAPQTITVGMRTSLESEGEGEGGTSVIATSSGDATVGPDDDWFVIGASTDGAPVMAQVVSGSGGDVRPVSASIDYGEVAYDYVLTLAPGEQATMLQFSALRYDPDEAIAAAEDLAALLDGATDGMTSDEIALLSNFENTFRTLSVAVTSPAADALAQPGDVFSSATGNAVTVDIMLALGAGHNPVTSIDLNSIVFPGDVVFDTNLAPTNVVVETTTAIAGWSVAAGPSLTAGALDIALAAGAGTDAEILEAEASTANPLPILTLTYNDAVTVPLASNGAHADLTQFGATDVDLDSFAILESSAFVNSGVPSAAASVASPVVNIIEIVSGDVSGDGDIAADDAQQTLVAVAGATLSAPSDLPTSPAPFGVQLSQPSWASLTGRLLTVTPPSPAPVVPLNAYSAFAVADVDEDASLADASGVITGVTSLDAAYMLQFAVGQITEFPTNATPLDVAPSLIASSLEGLFRVSSTSVRPGAQVTVSLNLDDVRDLYAGELRLDYDTAALRLVDVRINSSSSPLIAHSASKGDLGIAFASARPIGDGTIHAVFEAAPGTAGTVPASVRARRLVLNRTRVDTGFEHRFLIEPYQFQLMANYPNPFNPETWIPFELAEESAVTIHIYGLTGRVVRTLDLGALPVGIYASRYNAAHWDGRNDHGEAVASGTYIYEIRAGAERAVRRMVVLK